MPGGQQRIVLAACGVVGWALCGAVMGIGVGVTTLDNALTIHAVAAPLIFGALAATYFGAYPEASVYWTATAWLGTIIFLDVIFVAALVERSLAMFQSPLGTWIPFALIFVSTVTVGRLRAFRRAAGGHRPA